MFGEGLVCSVRFHTDRVVHVFKSTSTCEKGSNVLTGDHEHDIQSVSECVWTSALLDTKEKKILHFYSYSGFRNDLECCL